MCDFHYGKRSLHLGRFVLCGTALKTVAGACSVVLLSLWLASPFSAQELIEPDAFGPDGLVAFIETNELDVQAVVVKRLHHDASLTGHFDMAIMAR